ncbi:hypothetical protein CK203_031809 [Vitis vinifera]|uniref:Bifunctional inhibitor/plant lipid transfer protein/seed storage helical domain-containing protein n=1 Tax=Vitis vinifera TaxID=29760 RepID=A0A438INC4_VITVI|nr:hypothetical protein CK203_031809 [Vitis vinifera]
MMRSMRAVLVLVVSVLVCIWGNIHLASADMSPTECKEERKLAGNACRPMLYGQNPSANCCQRIRVTHVECIMPLRLSQGRFHRSKPMVLTSSLRKLKGVEGQFSQFQVWEYHYSMRKKPYSV